MAGYVIYGDIEELEDMVKGIKLGEKALRNATVRAINKTATSSVHFISKLIRKDYNVKAYEIKRVLNISKANKRQANVQAQLYGSGKPGIPLYKFAPTPSRVPSTRRTKSGGYTPKGGIKVLVTKGQRKVVADAFVAQMPNGKIGVFKERERGIGNWWNAFRSKSRIKQLYGPSPIRLIDSDHIQIPLDDFVGDTLDKNMKHEADFYLKKAGLL